MWGRDSVNGSIGWIIKPSVILFEGDIDDENNEYNVSTGI